MWLREAGACQCCHIGHIRPVDGVLVDDLSAAQPLAHTTKLVAHATHACLSSSKYVLLTQRDWL